jgi:hypothetical protein
MPRNITRRDFVRTSIRLTVVSPLVPLDGIDTAQLVAIRIGAGDRRALRAAIDVIIPAEGRMPSATAVGALGYVERLTTADAKMRELLLTGVRALDAHSRSATGSAFATSRAEQQAAAMRHIEKIDTPAGFVATLRDVVYEAYYTQPRVWKLIGYSFRQSNRRTATLQPFDEERVARVRAMRPFYRQVPS